MQINRTYVLSTNDLFQFTKSQVDSLVTILSYLLCISIVDHVSAL
jgi:hypothetical protein